MALTLAKIERTPPFLVYALCRRRGRRPNITELAKESGIPVRTFTRIKAKHSWDRERYEIIRAFCEVCGVDPLRMGKHRRYLKRSMASAHPLKHLGAAGRRAFARQCQTAAASRSKRSK